MTGLWTGEPIDSLAERAAGLDLVPTSAGQVNAATFGSALANNPMSRIIRDTPAEGILGLDAVYEAPEPTMEASEAQAKYPGIKVSTPVPESVAQAMYRHYQNEQLRADILARSDGSLLASAPVGFAVGLAAGLLDPLNIAAGLVPVFGQARTAAMVARAGGIGGRAAVRAGIGAAEGAVGMAALEPLQYGLDRFEGNDWTMGDAVHRIAMGAAMGAVLHAGPGVVRDWWGRDVPATSARAELLGRLEKLDPEARAAAFDTSVAAVAEGRPVEADPLVRFAEARQTGSRKTPEQAEANYAAQSQVAGYNLNPERPLLGRLDFLKERVQSPDLTETTRRDLQSRIEEFEQTIAHQDDLFKSGVITREQFDQIKQIGMRDTIVGRSTKNDRITGEAVGFDRRGIDVEDVDGVRHDVAWEDVERVQKTVTPPTSNASRPKTLQQPEQRHGGRAPSLLEFLAGKGGVRDDGGELRSMDLHLWHTEKPFRRRLVREAVEPMGDAMPGIGVGKDSRPGMSLDDATRAAWEAGYLGRRPERAGGSDVGRPDINVLLSAMDREARGERVLPEGAVDRAAERRAAERDADLRDEIAGAREEAHAMADEMGVSLKPEEADHAARAMVLDRVGAEEAVMEALRVSEVMDMEARGAAEAARVAAIDLRDAAANPHTDPADIAAERAATETLARAPRAEGPMDAQAAELSRLFNETRAMVEAEVKAGRMTEGDLAALKEAELKADNLEGDARASEEAGACLIATGAV